MKKEVFHSPLHARGCAPEQLARQLQAEARAAHADPQGSWTGVPENPYEEPIQDADDL